MRLHQQNKHYWRPVSTGLQIVILLLLIPEGASSQWVNSLPGEAIFTLYSSPPYVFCSTSDERVFKSSDDGFTWLPSDNNIRGIDISAFVQEGSSLFASGGSDGGTFISTDTGNSWAQISYSPYGVYEPVGYFGTIGGVIIAGADDTGVLVSKDTGKTWAIGSKGLKYPISPPIIYGHALPGPFLTVRDTLYGCTLNGLYLSLDSGISWEMTDSTIPDTLRELTSIDSCSDYIFTTPESRGVLRSSDGGKSWERVNSGLKNLNIQWILSANGILFCSLGEYGLYRSSDLGESWDSVASMYAVPLLVVDSFLLVGDQNGGGIYRHLLSGFGSSEDVKLDLSTAWPITAYPNPLTRSTTISFSSPESGAAEVTIVNLLGSEVKRIFSGELSLGEHEFSWNASGMPPGVYECVVRVGGKSQEIPIVLEK